MQRSTSVPTRVAFGAMYLDLGNHRFDVTHRAVVLGCAAHRLDEGAVGDWRRVTGTRVSRAAEMVAAGVDVLDVGGAPTDAGEALVEEDERERLVAVVQGLRARFDLPLSVSTGRASVAASCFEAGADIAEDHSGFGDPEFLSVCAASGASVVASNAALAAAREANGLGSIESAALASDYLVKMVHLAIAAGIPSARVMVDPTAGRPAGAGSVQTALMASRRLADAGNHVVLCLPDGDQSAGLMPDGTHGPDANGGFGEHVRSMDSSVANLVLGIARGCRIVRTHDVRAARRVAGVMAAMLEHR